MIWFTLAKGMSWLSSKSIYTIGALALYELINDGLEPRLLSKQFLFCWATPLDRAICYYFADNKDVVMIRFLSLSMNVDKFSVPD